MSENIKLQTGEYEVVIVFNPISFGDFRTQKITFPEHICGFDNPDEIFRREDIYGEFGRFWLFAKSCGL